MTRRIGAIIRILRPVPATAAAVTVWIGAGLGPDRSAMDTPETARLALMIFLAVAVANVYNDIRDITADVINGRPRPIAQGRLSVGHGWRVLGACLVGSVLLGASVGWGIVVTDVVLIAASLGYSRYVKGTVLWGNALVALLGSVPILLGALAGRAPVDRAVAAQALLFTYMFGYEVLKSLRDTTGDTAAGYVTVANRLGSRTTLAVWLTLSGAFIALSVGFGLGFHLDRHYFLLMLPAVDGTLAVVGIRVWTQRMTVARAVSFCTVAWLPGLLALGRLG
ncbi:MAG: UbiA family prenyltransferase [Actinoplanes sp.]